MGLEAEVRSRSLADAMVASLIGSRFTPYPLPEKSALPAVTYHTVSSGRVYTMDGDTGGSDTRLQMTVHAATYADALAVANALRARWSGYSGTYGAVTFGSSFLVLELDSYQADQEIYYRVLDFRFFVVGG